MNYLRYDLLDCLNFVLLTTVTSRRLTVIVPSSRVIDPVSFGKQNTRPKMLSRIMDNNDTNPIVLNIPTPQWMFGRRIKYRRPSVSTHHVCSTARRRPIDTLSDCSNERIIATRPIRIRVEGRLFS